MSSNRNDFDFDDDFFNDDAGGPAGGAAGGNRGGGSLPDDFNFGDDDGMPAVDLGGGRDELPPMEDAPEPGGTSRAFIVIAILMMLTFIGGLVLAVVLITQPQGPTPDAITATFVSEFNSTQIAFLAATQTQARGNELGTLTAVAATDTPSPTLTPSTTPTLTPEPLATLTATIDPALLTATDVIGAFAGTATALANLTLTPPAVPTLDAALAGAGTLLPTLDTGLAVATRTPTPPGGGLVGAGGLATVTPTQEGAGAIGALNQTATAIVGQFQTATAQAGGGIVPGDGVIGEATEEAGIGGGDASVPTPGGFVGLIPTPEVLPDTGLFDGVVSGGGAAIPALAMMIVGLVGVIFAARKLRSGGKK